MRKVLVPLVSALILLAAGSAWLALYPYIPDDLAGMESLDPQARKVRIPVGEEDAVEAWHLSGERAALVVLLPGYARDHRRMWRYAEFLRKDGYGILAVDFRSARFWNRKPTTLGHWEQVDLRAVLDWVAAQPQFRGHRVALYGESLGGSTALAVAADRPEIAAVVVDCPFSSGELAIRDAFSCVLRLPSWPLAPLSRIVGRQLTGHDPAGLDAAAALSRMETRPVLLVQSTMGERFSVEQADVLTKAAGAGVREWRVGSGHNRAWLEHREEYETRVREFLAPRLRSMPLVAAMPDSTPLIERAARAAGRVVDRAVRAAAKRLTTPTDAPK